MDTLVDKQIAQEVAKQLLKIKAVSINTKKPYRYVSGMLAPLYTDNRLLISHPAEWKVVIEKYIDVIQSKLQQKPDVLSGTATAAIPHAAVIGYQMQIPMIYVRSSKKDHGKENLIEGELKAGSKVLIIEDLISTGKSIGLNVNAIREAGGVVTHCLAITTSNLGAFVETVQGLNIELKTLTNIQTVVEEAVKGKYVSQEEADIVHKFLNNPKGWGHEMGFE